MESNVADVCRAWAAFGSTLLACVAGLSGLSCTSSDQSPQWTVSDSAGVEIVANVGSAARWILSEEPALTLGVVDQGGPTEFFRVSDIALLDDGGLAVANSGTEEVRLFAPGGAHLGSFGRDGRGPREFRRLSIVESYSDSLLTYDEGNDRISVWTLDGTWVRSFRLEWFTSSLAPVDLMGHDGILAVTAHYMTELEGTGLVVDTALVSHYDIDGQLVDSLVRLPHNERVVQRQGDFQTTLGAPFSSFAQIVGGGPGFCYAFGPITDVRCYDTKGTLTQIVRVPLERREVTKAHIDEFWKRQFEEATGPRLEAFRRMRDMMPFPSAFPAYSQLLVDDAGRLWARLYALPGEIDERWFVFENGRLVSEVRSPTGFRVMDFRDERIAGVWTDDLGIEFVRVYELEST
jgi:hypothetical protein